MLYCLAMDEPKPLVEGEDFTFENGLMVLTAKYLLKRGYCCGNDCRNCPYEGGDKMPSKNKKDSSNEPA